mgnify:CR=1 FL=1
MRAEFDESLVTGNEMIDSQHKELIDKINKLLDSCETSKDKVVSVKHWIISQITQNSILEKKKNCRKRLHIRVWKSTKKSMKN